MTEDGPLCPDYGHGRLVRLLRSRNQYSTPERSVESKPGPFLVWRFGCTEYVIGRSFCPSSLSETHPGPEVTWFFLNIYSGLVTLSPFDRKNITKGIRTSWTPDTHYIRFYFLHYPSLSQNTVMPCFSTSFLPLKRFVNSKEEFIGGSGKPKSLSFCLQKSVLLFKRTSVDRRRLLVFGPG